jgi:hypothetical protein
LAPWFCFGLISAAALGWLLLSHQVLLPSVYLRYAHPWAAQPGPAPPPWNSLLWDGIAQYFPWRLYAATNLRAGIIPLWNPHQFCGAPFLANGQSALLYPLNLPFWLLPVERAFGVSAFLHLAFAGLFTYFFLVRLRLHPFAAILAAIAFPLNGLFATWIHLPTAVNAAAWLPFLLWSAECARTSPRPFRWLPASALGIACCFFAGHIQTSFYVLFAFVFYSLFRGLSNSPAKGSVPASRPPAARPAADAPEPEPDSAERITLKSQSVWLGASLLLGLLLVAAQLLPSSELASLSHRTAVKSLSSYRTYVSFALPVPQLSLLLLPFSWGDPSQGTYFGKGTLSEFCPYVGFVSLLLALCSTPKTRPSLWWTSVGFCLFSLLAALGAWNNALFFFLIPGFERTGGPARILLLWHFFVNVLAALGMANLLSLWRTEPARAGRRILLSLLGLLALLLLLVVAYRSSFLDRPIQPPNPLLLDTRSLYVILAGVIICMGISLFGRRINLAFVPLLLGVLLLCDLSSFWARSVVFSPAGLAYPKTAITNFLQSHPGRVMPVSKSWSLSQPPQAALPPNSAMAYGLSDVQGYDSLFPGIYKSVLAAFLQQDPSPQANGNMILLRRFVPDLPAFLAAPHVASLLPLPSPSLYSLGKPDDIYLYECRSALPRAYLAGNIVTAQPGEDPLGRLVFEWMVRPAPNAFPPTMLLSPLPPAIASQSPRSDAEAATLPVQDLTPNVVRLSTSSLVPGLAVLRDCFYPGWRSFLDGRPAAILPADLLFRATALPPGSHRIDYVFEPSSFKAGLFLTLLGCAVLAFLATFSLLDGKWRTAPHPRVSPAGKVR